MGTKNVMYTVIAVFLCLLAYGTPIHAETVSDLYDLYSVPIVDSVPQDVKDTVQAYNDAQVYAARYRNVSAVETDTVNLEKQIQQCKLGIQQCEKELQNGYYLPIETILQLEMKIQQYTDRLKDLEKSMKSSKLEMPDIDVNAVPTREEYLNAKQVLESSIAYELGDITGLELPVTGTASILQASDKYIVVETPASASVLALFRGTVQKVDGDYVRISHGDNTFVEYYGLDNVSVTAGSTIEQFDRIGSARQQFQLSLSMDGRYYNPSRLFSEGGN